MTWALCLNCGAVKFGAICPCPKCQVASTGDMMLDIAFSDHHMGKETLHEFGEVIATLHQATSDETLRFWTFIRYISVNHPSILGVELNAEVQQQCDALLAQVELPPVTMRPSPREQWEAEQQSKPDKRWWEFWKSSTNGANEAEE